MARESRKARKGPAVPEDYSDERVAEFLLNNASTPEGYAAARAEVEKLGLDPDQIPHEPPHVSAQ
jgi:hypothetical protein